MKASIEYSLKFEDSQPSSLRMSCKQYGVELSLKMQDGIRPTDAQHIALRILCLVIEEKVQRGLLPNDEAF